MFPFRYTQIHPKVTILRELHRFAGPAAAPLALILAGFGFIGSQSVFAQKAIVPNGNTQTSVSTTGAVTNVITNTIRGDNAYNSFSTFNVNQGNTVNLFLPTGTDNLLNLVNSQTSAINGVLNSIKNGKIGGNLFFADPYGFIIGKTGSVNAGSFLAVTPTPAFMNQFFTAPGVPSPNAAASLLNGTVPITPDGLISVQGKINAAQSIGLFAGKVTNSGTIASGAVFSGAKPDFSDVVNVAGLQTGSAISVQNGTVEIQAAGDFENSGTISTNGANNLNAGNIDIHGNNVKLDPNSLISARGEGQKSNGGKVTIFADKNSELDSNAVVTAAGGDVSGNGGSIDFSAKDTASLNGGVLKAGAAHGIAGSVTIDPTDLNVTANDTPNDGSNLSFSGDTITVAPSVVISSRQIGSGTDFLNSPSTGNSGSITFTANSTAETPSITIGNGAEILAHATGQYTPGDITFTASQTNNASQAVAAANINIGNALIQGGNINISATAQATADSSANPAVANSNFVDTKLNLVNGAVAENTSSATSGITIGDSNSGNAQITASGTLAINSTATSSTTSKLSSTIGLAYGESDSTATATIGKTAVLNAGGALSVNANSKNTLNVKETISQNSTDVAAFAYGNASSNSSAEVDGSVTGGSVQIGATNTNSFSTNASATDYGTQATSAAGAGIALGFYQSNANTNLTGSATSTGGDVQIASATTNSANTTRSSSSLPSQGIKAQIAKGQNWTQSLDGSSGLLSKIASGQTKFGSAPAVASQANSTNLGLTAAVSIAESGNSATTTVSGNVTSQGGKVNVSSQATDNPQISAAGSVGGENADLGGAVAVSDFHNTADTYVNGNAAIMGAGAVSITAEADILNPASQSADQVASGFTGIDSASDLANDTNLKNLVSSITTALQGAADPGAFTTSYVNTGMSTAGDSSGGFGIGGAVNLLGLTNQSVASVTGSAKVTANAGDLSVNATSKAALINAAGMGLVPGQIAMANPGVKAGTSVGGSYNGVNLSNTSTAYIGDGTTATASQGNVNVNATTNTFVINLAQAGDKATQFGITGTFDDGNLTDNAEAYIQSNATVSAGQGVNVSATNPLTDIAVGGALGIGGSGQVGVAVNWNQINDTTLAYIGDPSNPLTSASGKVTGSNVNLTASSTEDVYGITFAATKSGNSGKGADGESTSPPTDAKTADSAPTSGGDEVKGESGDNGAGGGQYGFGISGEIAFNQITNGSGPGVTTEAFINNGANVTATNGNISPTATDTLFAVAGGLAGTVGQTNALAGAYSQNTFDKQVQAFTGNATVNGNGLNIQAISNGSLFDVTAGGAINTESGTALAGSVNNNSITNTVSASLGTGTNAASIGGNGITVNASEGSNGDQVLSVAGGFGISVGEAGVGAAVDYGNYTNNVSSSIGGTSVGTTGNVQVTSSTNVNYLPIAASLAVGSDFGAAGSAAVDQISDTTTSTADGTVTARGNLVIASNDSSSALIVGGGVGISGDTGVGVTAVIPQFSRTTESLIANSAHVSAQGNGSPISYDGQNVTGMLLDAKTTGNLQDYSVAGSASGEASIAGAVILNPFYASNPNSLKDDTEANIGSSAVVNGSNNGAAGQSVSLIASDTSGIQDAAGMLAIGGDLGAGVGFDVVSPSWTVNTSIGSGATVNAANNVVTASNLQNSINSYAVSGAGSGEAAAAGAATLINETSNTTANIDGTVAAGGNVDVSAIRNTSKLNSLDGNAAVALNIGVGFGISASDITTNDTVDASLGGAANVTALGNGGSINVPNGQLDSNGNPVTASFQGLSVTAMSHGSVNPIAAGGAGSGGISVDGSAPVNNLTETTQAHIDSGAAVNTNNSGANSNESVQTLATDDTNLNSIAGTLSVGLGSLAAALDFDTVNRTVTANISGASVKAADNALIGALTEGSLQSTAASGSVGGFSGAGAASTVNETTNTNAYIDGGSNVSANNNVAVAANRNTSLTIHDGGAAFGALDGLAASVANVNQSNTVQAYVGDSSGSTTSVTALGQGSGISAPVDSSGNPAAGTVSGLSVTAQGTETLQMIAAGGAIGSGVGLSGSILTNSFTENTSAKIDSSASINSNNAGAGSSQGVNLLASDTTNLTAGAGALGGAANGVGIGLGVDAENIHKTTTAGIDNGANLKTNAAINVDALSKETINSYTAAIGVGVGGAAGTSADYQTHPIDPTTTADISGATINSGSLGVNANDNLSLTAKTGEVSAGGVALGAATALVNANANTSASVSGGSITLSPNGALSVISGYTGNVQGTALSGSGGLFSGNAVKAQLADNSTNSASLSGSVQQAGAVNVDATTNRTVNTTGGSLAVSGLGAGAVIASTSAAGSTTASVAGSIGQTTGENVQSLGAAATDSSNTSSTSHSLAAGIGNGQFNESSATVGGTVQASLAAGSAIRVAGNLGLTASGDDGASASNNGLNIGGVSVGESESFATVNPTVRATVGQNATVGAGQNISINAAYNYNPASDTALTGDTVAADSSSSVGSLVGVVGATSSASSRPTVQASFGTGSTVSAGNNMTVQSLSSNTISSDANGNAFAVAGSQGNTTSTSTVTNNNTITTASGVTLAAGNNLTLTAQSTNKISNASAEGTQTGLIGAGNNTTTATASLNDTTAATVGTSNQINGGANGTALIQALANNQANSNSTDFAANAFGGTNTATANTDVTTNNTTEISGSSNVQAGTVALDAEVTNEQYSATAVSNTYTLKSDATANSNVEVTSNVNANVDGGAGLTGGNAITIKADQENLLGNSSANAKVVGASGSPTANSDNNLNDNSNVNIAPLATLTTNDLSVEATAPFDKGTSYEQTASAAGDTTVTWVTETVEETVDEVFGWIPYVKEVTKWVTKTVEDILHSDPTANQTGNFTPTNTIAMNGTIVQPGGINPALVASNVAGVPTLTTDRNVNASISGQTITVNDLINQIQPTIAFNAPNGTVQGNFTVQRNTTWTGVSITNNTSDNLVINNINPLTSASASNPDVNVSAANNTSSFTLVDTNTGATGIVVQNNSGSDVTLAGVINNPGGSTTVNNSGGNIFATGSELLKEANTTLDATAGSVGSSGNYMNVQMTAETAGGNTAAANLSVTAGQNVFLNAKLVQDVVNTAPASIVGPANVNSVTAGGAVNLNLLQPQAIVYGVSSDNPPVLTVTPTNATGVYNINNVTGGNNVNINQAAGPMKIGTVASTNGNVSLTAQSGDVDLGTVNSAKGTTNISASGSVVDTNHTSASDINAVNLNLTATNGSIGTSSDPLNIDSSYNGAAGQVMASAKQGVYLNQVADNLNLGTITSQTSDAVLTSAGSIMDTNSGTASSINAANVNLTAGGSIGGTTVGTLEIDATGQLTASANQNASITQTAGAMNVNAVTATNGNVNLAASNGDVDLGTVNSGKDTTIIASGSISDTNSTAVSSINGVNVNLTAQGGSIGGGAGAGNTLDIDATGQLTAQASQDADVNQTAGSMKVNTVGSTNGNVNLTAPNGDVDLGTVNSTKGNTNVIASGSITDTNSTPASSINAVNVNLTAQTGSIGGTTTGTLDLDATGQLTATANQNANITQTTGPMNVNTVTATNGNVNLAASSGDVDLGTVNSTKGNTTIVASGSISDNNSTAASSINAINVNLTAQGGSISGGTGAGNTLNIDATGQLTASANQSANITQTTGAMKVNTVTATNGNVNLTTNSGDVDLGTVRATKGNIAIASSGSILNTSGGNASSVNLTGNNMTLTATNGSIGTSSSALFANNQNPATLTNGAPSGSNFLNATASGDTYVTEAQGNLLSSNVSSTTGNIGLVVSNGNGNLNQIVGNQAITLLVNGSLLNIGTISGSTGTSAKAPSPNTVSLTVSKAGGALTVNQMSVFQSIYTRADNTNLNTVIVTNLANPQLDTDHQAQSLHFDDAGYSGGLANTINVNIVPCSTCYTSPAVIFDNYLTKNGNVFASMDWLEFIKAELTGSGQFQNAWENFILTGKGKSKIGPWYFFLIGDKFARSADQYDTVSPARYLQLPNHYTWVQPPTVVFPYLLSLYGFSSSTSTSNF